MSNFDTATLAGGCFWCTEAIFEKVKGIELVESGYTGGEMEKPFYEDVSTGETGHAEAIQITFDPKIISYEKLLDIFFKFHDPTTPNRQGADMGTQYRSVIFYHDETQKEIAQKVTKELEDSGTYKAPIVTQITLFKSFSKAEDYHQDFYNKNPNSFYCRVVIDPKIQKLMKDFKTSVILN